MWDDDDLSATTGDGDSGSLRSFPRDPTLQSSAQVASGQCRGIAGVTPPAVGRSVAAHAEEESEPGWMAVFGRGGRDDDDAIVDAIMTDALSLSADRKSYPSSCFLLVSLNWLFSPNFLCDGMEDVLLFYNRRYSIRRTLLVLIE